MWEILSTAAGVVLLAVVAVDVFYQLFHPHGTGSLSAALSSGVGWVAGRIGGRALILAGPMALVSVLTTWFVVMVAAWVLILLPHVPDGFTYGPGIPAHHPLVDAIYISSVGISTLGYGDIVPEDPLLRLLVPIEAALGFALLTAGLTWVLSSYPPLVRQRSLARQAHEVVSGADVSPGWLRVLTQGVATATTDIRHFSVLHHFHTIDRKSELADALPLLRAMAMRLSTGDSELNAEARRLVRVIDDYVREVATGHMGLHGDGDIEELMEAYRSAKNVAFEDERV